MMTMEHSKEATMDLDTVPGNTVDLPDSTMGASSIVIDPVLEKRAIAKFDKFMMPQMALLMLIAYLDRTNIGLFDHSRVGGVVTNMRHWQAMPECLALKRV